ncbi:MAG: hypothetical protein JXA28_07415 [Bacteroidetes bacterium]|nr:hypothetical protein [Bacteroidota bacterium]
MQRAIVLLAVLLLPFTMVAQYGSVNSALTLTGSGYLSVPYSNQLNMDLSYYGVIAMDAWVRPASIGTQMTVIGNDAASGYWFGLSTAGKVRFSLNPASQYESNSSISANVWTHIAVHYYPETGVVRFYVNNTLDRTINVPQGWIGYAYGDLRIGADRSGSSAAHYWRGSLDEVRIWREAINFATAEGELYKIPHAVAGGLYGRELLAAWRLNGDGRDPVGGHHGTAVGSVSYSGTPDPPFYNRIGIWFRNPTAGAQSVDHFLIPFGKDLELRSNYTIEMWIKPSTSGGHAQYQTLFCKTVAVAAVFPVWIGINKTNNRIRFVPNGDAQDWFESTIAAPAGQWTHVAARYSGSGGKYTATIFINGQPRGQKNYTTAGPSNSAPILLGASSTSPGANILYQYFGLIDELRIWNSSRSDLAIADNYRREIPGSSSMLSGNYHFDGDVLDASGSYNHGSNSYGYALWYFYRTEDLPSEPMLTLTAPADGAPWTIGDTYDIAWKSEGLYYVTIELSRDAGSTWTETLLNAGDATTGKIQWTVTGPETSDAHIRIRTPTATGLEDRATKISIRQPRPVLNVIPSSIALTVSRNAPLPPPIPVILRNAGGGTLSWTTAVGSADWLSVDPDQGTANMDTFEVQITRTDLTEGVHREMIVIGGNAENAGLQLPVELTITAQRVYSILGTLRDANNIPVEAVPVKAFGERDAEAVSNFDGKYELEYLPSGNYSVMPASFYFQSDPAQRYYAPLNNFEIGADFTLTPKRGSLLFRYHEGWNLVSIPLDPDEKDLQKLLPDAIPPAYAWDPDTGYVMRTALEGTKAYWIKFARRDSVVMDGVLIRDMAESYATGETGWHLLGMPSGPCPVSGVVEAPTGILTNPYEYDPVYGYLSPIDAMFVAGKGYFVKILGAGVLRIRAREEVTSSPARMLFRFPGVERVE